MIVDNKLFNLKNYLSDTRLNQASIKTTLHESAVTSTGKNNVDMSLNNEGAKKQYEQIKKKLKSKEGNKAKKNSQDSGPKSKEKTKITNLKKLNLL